MKGIRQHIDDTSLLVMLITLVLFVAALFAKGMTHDLLLEAGVFPVSVKLIMMAYQNSVATQRMLEELAAVRSAILQDERAPKASSSAGEREPAGRDH